MYKISDYPEIQNNFFLKGRNVGASKKLVGTVNLLTVFLKRGASDWQQEAKTRYYSAVSDAADWIMREAKRYGADLTLRCFHLETAVPSDASPKDGFSLVKGYFGRETMEEVQNHYQSSMKVDEVPVILAFNEAGRSFAFKKNTAQGYRTDEISVVFLEDSTDHDTAVTTIAHELLHQFGAVDYYFPKEVKQVAERYLAHSVMGVGYRTVDDLTAYLVGWKDTISANSYWFLKETVWMDELTYREAKQKQWDQS